MPRHASKLIQDSQAIAQREQLPIWLEATTEHSAKIYSKLGFETIEEIVLGKGKAGANGLAKKDGRESRYGR